MTIWTVRIGIGASSVAEVDRDGKIADQVVLVGIDLRADEILDEIDGDNRRAEARDEREEAIRTAPSQWSEGEPFDDDGDEAGEQVANDNREIDRKPERERRFRQHAIEAEGGAG